MVYFYYDTKVEEYKGQSGLMQKYKKFENKKKRLRALAVGLTISVVAILVIFYSNYNRIYKLFLEKDMEQIKFTSNYVTKLIQTEIENLLSVLEARLA